jgi:hypothetical protein
MANLKNWQPEMTGPERRWFDACPKAVLFEMCRQMAMLACGEEDADKAFARMQDEWATLHWGGIVPQRPYDVEKGEAKLAATLARQAQHRALASK